MSDKLAIARRKNEELQEARGVDPSTWLQVQERVNSTPLAGLVDLADSLPPRDKARTHQILAEAYEAKLEYKLLTLREIM